MKVNLTTNIEHVSKSEHRNREEHIRKENKTKTPFLLPLNLVTTLHKKIHKRGKMENDT